MAIKILDAPYGQQLQMLAAGKLDACFFPETTEAIRLGLAFEPLYEDALVCCVSPESPLALNKTLSCSDLAGQRVYIESVYETTPQVADLMRTLREEIPDAKVDGRRFDATLPTLVMVEGGVIPVPSRYASDSVPPLTATPLEWPTMRFGVVSDPGAPDELRIFLKAAHDCLDMGSCK